MFHYHHKLKYYARKLRKDMTEAEQQLWWHLRYKQLNNTQFYRQKPIGWYIVDFYAPSARLVVEVDGSQHFEKEYQQQDDKRDEYLRSLGITVLRFNNLMVLQSMDEVLQVILNHLK